MKKLAIISILPLVLAACEGSRGYQNPPQAEKASCAGGNFQACSEIGHRARAAAGGPAIVQYPPFSHPIID